MDALCADGEVPPPVADSDRVRLRFKTRLIVLIVVLSNVFGNSALTYGMKHRASEMAFSPASILETIFSPWVGLGIILLTVWLLSRMAMMSWADLSYVLPVTSIGFALSAVAGRFFFNERISVARWSGIACIVAGMMLVGRTRPNTTAAARPGEGTA